MADDAAAWRDAGFNVVDGTCRIGAVSIRLLGRTAGTGVRAWSFRDLADDVTELDGIPTRPEEPTEAAGPDGGAHPNGVELIDHVVVATPDPERTIAALERAGRTHRRTRLPEDYPAPMRQDFFRAGEVILELIGPRDPDPAKVDRPARIYGLAHTVADLDVSAAALGPLLGPASDAVQPGRRIATVRTRDLDLSVPTALLTPGPGALR
ncbi:MAG TPA: hypothetical protein PKA98_23520 [Acidimicrobiales bacterium]|nr:hypothetical protein [Acidimicrobiales bacterium]